MRTTLDLDETVLAAARTVARRDGVSLGRAISDLALRGLSGAPDDFRVDFSYAAFPVLLGDPDRPITDDLVAAHRDD